MFILPVLSRTPMTWGTVSWSSDVYTYGTGGVPPTDGGLIYLVMVHRVTVSLVQRTPGAGATLPLTHSSRQRPASLLQQVFVHRGRGSGFCEFHRYEPKIDAPDDDTPIYLVNSFIGRRLSKYQRGTLLLFMMYILSTNLWRGL